MLSAAERSMPVNYDNAGEQPVRVITPLVAVLAVVNTFIVALLVIAFLSHTGISYVSLSSVLVYRHRYLFIDSCYGCKGRHESTLTDWLPP